MMKEENAKSLVEDFHGAKDDYLLKCGRKGKSSGKINKGTKFLILESRLRDQGKQQLGSFMESGICQDVTVPMNM